MAAMRVLVLAAMAMLAAACDKEKDVAPPAELVDFDATASVDRVWSASTKGGDDVLRLGLQPAVQGERVYVAGHGGDVRALEIASGRELWRASLDIALAGGPAVGEGVVVVGSSAGDLVALDAESGTKRWQIMTGGEVLAAPTIAGGIVAALLYEYLFLRREEEPVSHGVLKPAATEKARSSR